MEVTAASAAVAFVSLTLWLANLYFRWRVVKLAAEKGRKVKISGRLPWAPIVELGDTVTSIEEQVRQNDDRTLAQNTADREHLFAFDGAIDEKHANGYSSLRAGRSNPKASRRPTGSQKSPTARRKSSN